MKIDDDFSVCLLHSLFIISLRFNSQGALGVVGQEAKPQHEQTKSQVISQSQSQQRREAEGDEDKKVKLKREL